MILSNHNHISAPCCPPDDSIAIAAESEYLDGTIGEIKLLLCEAETAARAEQPWRAKAVLQRVKDLLDEIED